MPKMKTNRAAIPVTAAQADPEARAAAPSSRFRQATAPRFFGGAALFYAACLDRNPASRSIHGAKLGRARIDSI